MRVDLDSLIGSVLGGRYRVLRRVGAGGMGAVFEAEQLDLRRRVALKVLAELDPQSVARLQQEAMTAGGLQSQHVVAIFDFQLGAPPFLVMELLTGESLSTLLRREGQLEASRATRIAAQMLAGLEAAHRVGITHRDVKPSNVWISRSAAGEEHVKLLDFGIAKMHDVPGGVRTATGHFLGTPSYMAPEQLRGQPADARSDIHAVGVVLFEMLTGARPWRGANAPALPFEIIEHVPPPLDALVPATPRALAAAVARALEKDPSVRFVTAAEMAQTLQATLPTSWSAVKAAAPATLPEAPSAAASGGRTNTFDVAAPPPKAASERLAATLASPGAAPPPDAHPASGRHVASSPTQPSPHAAPSPHPKHGARGVGDRPAPPARPMPLARPSSSTNTVVLVILGVGVLILLASVMVMCVAVISTPTKSSKNTIDASAPASASASASARTFDPSF
ncbi:MAG: protein kinase [Labilithrix sp.]|nr:protein kinase [Labilithrix sp.]